MGLFNSSKNPDDKKKQAKEQKPKLRTFILEPILTPSGLVDGGDDVPDLIDLPDSDNFDFVEEVAEIAPVVDEDLSDDGSEALDFFEPDELADVDGFVGIESSFTSGYFTVGNSGQVEIDFLFDGGGYKGELAIFSLEGMEEFNPDSSEFIAEAASRASSDSELGHIVISDVDEGARFGGDLGEASRNGGEYLGIKAFDMKPGDEFGFMLVPNGNVEEVVANPEIGGAKTPLFSLATANPDDGFHFGQIADVTGDGHTFALEDLRVDGASDRDYNDIIFQVKGAKGEAALLDEVIDSELDWREGELGTEIIDYAESQIETDFDEVLASLNLDQEYQDSLTQAFDYVSQQLEDFVAEPDFVQKLNLALGDGWDEETASNLINNIASKQQLPSFEVVPFGNLNANGAFGEGTIYLSQEFLQQNLSNPEAVGKVILEELGHYLDSQLNSTDSPGDEGAIFAAVVTQDSYSPGEIAALQRENDVGTLTLLGGREVQVELVTSIPNISISGELFALEGDTGINEREFTLRLSEPINNHVSLNIATEDYWINRISAKAGEDYQAVDTTITFAPGETIKTFVVPIIGDIFREPTELFFITSSNVTNATIDFERLTATIRPDDSMQLGVDDISIVEGDAGTTNAQFTITSASIRRDLGVTFDFTTEDGTAIAGEDYQATSGTVTLPPGERTQTITVPIIGDSIVEGDETFNVILSNPSYATIVDSEGVGTIIDNDDSQPLQLNVSDATVVEGNTGTTDAQFTVSLSGSSTETVTVEYFTEDRDAVAGEDYQAISGTITFAPGETSKDILIPILSDTIDEVDETFSINLANPSVATVEDGEGIGTIVDDDQLLSNDIVLIEQENFGVSYEQNLTIPASSSFLTFTFSDLNFDTADPNFINDAFEVALVDGEGKPLVHTVGKGKDAFFNITEGEDTDLASGVTINGQTVQVNLTGITADTEAKLILRLVNDDSDTTTSVRITNIELIPGE